MLLVTLCWCPVGCLYEQGQALPVRMGDWAVPWLWAPEPEERLPLSALCLPRQPEGETQSRESNRKSGCLVEEGKLGCGAKAAWKTMGCSVA